MKKYKHLFATPKIMRLPNGATYLSKRIWFREQYQLYITPESHLLWQKAKRRVVEEKPEFEQLGRDLEQI